MFAVGGRQEGEFAINISLFGIEEEGAGMVLRIHKHLKRVQSRTSGGSEGCIT